MFFLFLTFLQLQWPLFESDRKIGYKSRGRHAAKVAGSGLELVTATSRTKALPLHYRSDPKFMHQRQVENVCTKICSRGRWVDTTSALIQTHQHINLTPCKQQIHTSAPFKGQCTLAHKDTQETIHTWTHTCSRSAIRVRNAQEFPLCGRGILPQLKR